MSSRRRALVLAGAILAAAAGACADLAPLLSPPTSAPVTTPGSSATIERVVDGDTVVLVGGERVRLIGVDTPESKPPRPRECYGEEAAAYLAALLPVGSPVRLSYQVERTDRYGRTLADVSTATGVWINGALVRDGMAQVATFPPNVAHVDELLALQREARAANRGLWGGCGDSLGIAP